MANVSEPLRESAWETGRSGAILACSQTHQTAGISGDGQASDRPRAHDVKLTSGGHTLGRLERPHVTASIDPKGYGRMRGQPQTAANINQGYNCPVEPEPGMQRPSQRAARPKIRHGGTRMGRRRRNPPPAQFLIIGHHCPVEPETVTGAQTQDRNKLPNGIRCQSRYRGRSNVTVKACVKVRKGRTYCREKDWILHQPGLGDHQAEPRRARCLRNPKARKTGPRHTMSIAGYLRNRLS